jgi:hypothetical protein
VTYDASFLSKSLCTDGAVVAALWNSACHCIVSEILSSCSAHSAGQNTEWLQMRELLQMQCSGIVTSCLAAIDALGAAVAGNGLWLLLTLCENALIPVCSSDRCTCSFDSVQALSPTKQYIHVEAPVSSLPPGDLAVSDKYAKTLYRCPYCCIKQSTAALSHVCTSISFVARPSSISIPSGGEDCLKDDDDYLSVSVFIVVDEQPLCLLFAVSSNKILTGTGLVFARRFTPTVYRLSLSS